MSRWLKWFGRSPIAAVLLVGVAYALFLGREWQRHDGDLSAFVRAGDLFTDPEQVAPHLSVLPNSAGYDGQFYYRLALDPWSNQVTAGGIRLDAPPYRQQRLLYPLLAYVISLGGRPELLPVALLLINYLGLLGLAGAGAAFAVQHGRSPWLGVSVAFYPGFLFSLTFDLTEILEAALLVGAYTLLLRRRPWAAAVLLAGALLAKETAVLAVVAWFLAGFIVAIRNLVKNGRVWQGLTELPMATAVIPSHWGNLISRFGPPVAALLVFLLWQGVLASRWGQWPWQAGEKALGWPLAGLLSFLSGLSPGSDPLHRVWLVELVILSAVITLAGWQLTGWRLPELPLAWLFYGGLVLLLTSQVWVEDLAFLRAMTGVVSSSLLLLFAGGKWAGRAAGVLLPGLWLYVALTRF